MRISLSLRDIVRVPVGRRRRLRFALLPRLEESLVGFTLANRHCFEIHRHVGDEDAIGGRVHSRQPKLWIRRLG